MRIIYARCCGLDVHKKSISACLLTPHEEGGTQQQVRRFGTVTRDLLDLCDWLASNQVTHVAMGEHGGCIGSRCGTSLRSQLYNSAGERPARESGSRTEDGCEGLPMDCRLVATRIVER